MVIHEESEAPVEVAVIREPALLESKKYVIVKNHVRELVVSENKSDDITTTEEKMQQTDRLKRKRPKRDADDDTKKEFRPSTSSTEIDNNASAPVTTISESDLDELRTVYNKCKAVIAKIEAKYGHLLNLDESASFSRKKRKKSNECTEIEECKYALKEKNDYDGKSRADEPLLDYHRQMSEKLHSESTVQSIIVEHEPAVLPDDLQDLSNILRNTKLEITYRNKVIQKMKSLRAEYQNEIRFGKKMLVEKLKTNSDELLDFNGTNLSTLPGYLY